MQTQQFTIVFICVQLFPKTPISKPNENKTQLIIDLRLVNLRYNPWLVRECIRSGDVRSELMSQEKQS